MFQLSKATDGINSDFNEVLAKITMLVSSIGVESREFMEILDPLKDDGLAAKEVYMKNLNELVLSRDLCEQKICNVSGFNVHLGKFTGYESEMDIFVEPHVQIRVLADVLKANHLGSNVLKLVKHLLDIEAI